MSPAAGVWLQDATYLAACMALLDGCGGFIDFDIIKNDISSFFIFYFFLSIFNVYMQPYGYGRPLAFRPFLSTPSQKTSFFSPFPRCLAAFTASL